jgi:multidrug efflux system membrane fusion protein
VDAYDRSDTNKIASGTLETVDNQIDPATGTARLKAVFSNEDNALFPQQFVNCRLLLETRRGITAVPSAAVQRGPQGAYVWIAASDGTAHMRPVTLGASEATEVQISSGIVPGDMVITDGQDKLQEGGKIDTGKGGPGSPNAGGGSGRRGAAGGRRGGGPGRSAGGADR